MDAGVGERLGQYSLGREIGRGAMAVVYEAEHVVLRKRVAVKRMHAHLAVDATGAARFLREGRAAAQIRSENVVEVFDVGSHEGVPYLVMERLDGMDLATLLRERKKLSAREVADVMVPVALAVHAAHLAGVVHRDLKPSNIFLAQRLLRRGSTPGLASARAERDGELATSPVILDFGISKLVGGIEKSLTASEALLGTVYYMSPEQTRGGSEANVESDQYALGAMLYECLTGARPFNGSTPYAVMHAIVSTKPVRPSTLDPGIPSQLDEVILRAMRRDPRERFPSVQALAAALLPWASTAMRQRYGPELGSLAEGSASGGRFQGRPRRWGLLVVAVALALAAAIAARLPHSRAKTGNAQALPAGSVGPSSALPMVAARAEEPPAMSLEVPVPKVSNSAPGVATSVPRSTPSTLPVVPPPPAHPRTERGTNGALILE